MSDFIKNTLCIIILAVIIYLICLLNKPKKMKPLVVKATNPPQAIINADTSMNANVNRSQESELVLDRPPLVEENPSIIPANELVQMNYKDWNSQVYADKVEKDFYTNDTPLFTEMGPVNLVPLDVNATGHRRINFY